MRVIASVLALGLGLGCANGYPISKKPTPALASGAPPADWDYLVTSSQGAKVLDVSAALTQAASAELSVSERAEPFVRKVQVERRGAWENVEPREGSWMVPDCTSGCRIRYQFALEEAAKQVGRDPTARRLAEGVFESPPHAWLLHPMQARKDERLRFRVESPSGEQFATGLPGNGVYELAAGDIGHVPYAIFGRWTSQSLRAGDTNLKLAILPGFHIADEELARWISRTAMAVEDYYGAYPLDGTLYVLIPSWGDEVGFGRAMAGSGGGSILVDVGRGAGPQELVDDWVAVHETIHLTFPSLAREHIWVEEGLATYLEPILRVRAGLLDEHGMWRSFHDMMAHGLPRARDQGLDRTHTWGRVYWGGALFWMVADLEIHKRTQNARALRDALRAILRAGGNNAADWNLERAWDVGDAATGTQVLREVGTAMAEGPVPVDLDGLFRDLGVVAKGGQVTFDDTAPLASVRKAITAR